MNEPAVLDGAALERLRRLGGDTLVRQMVELYLTNGPERLRTLSAGAESGDADSVERMAHLMKSSAGNVGAARLQRIAEAVESSAADGTIDPAMVSQLVGEYDESATLLRTVLDEEDA